MRSLFFFSFCWLSISFSVAQQGQVQSVQLDDAHPGLIETVIEDFTGSPIDGYNVYIPKSCKNGNKKYPMIVFLHGGGLTGGEVSRVLHYDMPKQILEGTSLASELESLLRDSFVVLMPHITEGQFYNGENAIRTIISRLIQNENVDAKRIYLTGLSRGGHGTWGLGARMADVFTAIAPICGSGRGISDYDNLKGLPIWVSHNTGDGVVSYSSSERIVERIESRVNRSFHRSTNINSAAYESHDLIFTSKRSDSHNAWTEMYTDANFYKWLLRFSK